MDTQKTISMPKNDHQTRIKIKNEHFKIGNARWRMIINLVRLD